MCWVQRKKDRDEFCSGLPNDDEGSQMTFNGLMRTIKHAEDELQLITKALQEREQYLHSSKAVAALGSRKLSAASTVSGPALQDSTSSSDDTSSSEGDKNGPIDYIATEGKYLRHRPNAEIFTSQSNQIITNLRQRLMQGIDVVHVTAEKKGAFGRKKASKRLKHVIRMSESGKEIKWGPTLKTLKKSVDVDAISRVLYGYKSDLFAKIKDSPTREELWTCITIEIEEKTQYDFVIADDLANTAVMVLLTPPRMKMTVARWRWIRSFHKFQLKQVGLVAAVNKMARAEDKDLSDDASSAASSAE